MPIGQIDHFLTVFKKTLLLAISEFQNPHLWNEAESKNDSYLNEN